MPFDKPIEQQVRWEELPDIDEVRSALKEQARIKAELKVAKLELESYQAWLSQKKPRDSSVKLVGVDEASRIQLERLLQRVVELEGRLDQIDADVKFNDYRLSAAKVMSYHGRTS